MLNQTNKPANNPFLTPKRNSLRIKIKIETHLPQRNNSIDPHVITVRRGMKNVMDVGQVIAVDGKTEQTVWKDTCNQYQGTDGTIFPPFLTENDRLESFSTDLCR